MGRTACTESQCLYSRAIPLLPLWAVRPVQRLSACTVELYLYSPYGPYGLYRGSVPVQGCTLLLPIFSETTLPIYHTTRYNLQRWTSTTNTNRSRKMLFRETGFHCEIVGTYKHTARAKCRVSDVKIGSQQCAEEFI
jgi:hypothetical protein